mgnify:CR=1 FL=1
MTPPCPFCGERQSLDEARPSKPRVVTRKAWERPHKAGCVNTIRETVYDTHCRSCGERMIWGFTYGCGRMHEIATATVRYHWSKP